MKVMVIEDRETNCDDQLLEMMICDEGIAGEEVTDTERVYDSHVACYE